MLTSVSTTATAMRSSEISQGSTCTLPPITAEIMKKRGRVNDLTAKKGSKRKTKTQPPVFRGKNENELQDYLSSNVEVLNAVDTHEGHGKPVEFLKPREFSGDITVYTNSGKADLTSKKRRMVFEVKSKTLEADLMVQMFERLVTSLDFSHITMNSIVFGATPDAGFVLIGERCVPTARQEPNRVSLRLFSVSIENIIDMWQLASNVQSPCDYLTEDAPLVIHSLKEAGFDPWLCRIRLLEWSQHNVYAVTLPAEFSFDKKKCTGVKSNVPDFAIKFVKDDAAFEREHAVLVATEQSFYMGASSKGCRVSISPDAFSEVISAGSRTQSGWPWWSNGVEPTTGGVIFMRFGEGLPETLDDALRTRIINDCIPELSTAHQQPRAGEEGTCYCFTE